MKDLSSYVMNNADDLDKTMTLGNKNREFADLDLYYLSVIFEDSKLKNDIKINRSRKNL